MEGGDQTIEQMIKSTRRGLLVTFFWYIRAVDPMTLLNTGMTRDGMFLIENGEIVGPVQNFRWNDGPARGFNNITMLGAAGADAHRRSLRQSRHRARAADEDRGLPDDVDLAGGVSTGRSADAATSLAGPLDERFNERLLGRGDRQVDAGRTPGFVQNLYPKIGQLSGHRTSTSSAVAWSR